VAVLNCRLLYLIGWLHTGGSERQLYYLLRTMDRERYRPAVAVWDHREQDLHVPQIRALGVPLHSFPRTLSRIAKLKAFRRLVRQLSPEVIHSYSFYTNFAAHWGAWGRQVVAVGSVRNDFTSEKKNSGPLLGASSARWPVYQICNSYSAAETIRRSRSLFAPSQSCVVRNGLDLDQFQAFPPQSENPPVRLLGVGYLLPAKRWDRLLLAARELKRQDVNCLIRIAGDGTLQESLEQTAQALEVEDTVQFIGHRDDIPNLLAESAFLVHTADNEGSPNAVMEAMACGRPVVATDAGDIPSLVQDGQTGFVVRRDDTKTLVERMVRLITDCDLRRRMGEAARAKAKSEFGLNRLVEETLAAYREAGWRET
jgi:glycosyltransferase involved in cell wall biosynthesis